jgi:hypothetical protein
MVSLTRDIYPPWTCVKGPCCGGRMRVEGMQALARRVNTIVQSSGTGAGKDPC